MERTCQRSKICARWVERLLGAAATSQTQMSAVAAPTASASARWPHAVRHDRASGPAGLGSQTCLTCRRRARGLHGRSGRSTQGPPFCSFSLTLPAGLEEIIRLPRNLLYLLSFSWERAHSVPLRLFGSRVRPMGSILRPSAHVAGRCAQVVIIHLTMTLGQKRRALEPPTRAETGSRGVLARHSSLLGADARAPPRSTSTGVRRADVFSDTTSPLIWSAVGPITP